jgi:hypothetical protein
MYYTKTIPDILIEHLKGDIHLVRSVVSSLIHNGIDFVADPVDGQWEIAVLKKNKRKLDAIIRRLESIR